MRKSWIVVIVLLIVVFGGIFGGKYYADRRAAQAAAHAHFPPAAVATTVAQEEHWPPEVSAVGSLEAISGTAITAQIAGNITEIAFHSGMRVKKGDLLVKVDDSTQLAKLHADLATLKLADANLARTSKLFASHATSLLDLQTAQANHGTAQATVEGDRATLAKLHITAPFAGVVGIRKVSLGQYLSPGTAIVDLQRYDPIHLNFSLPQSTLSDVRSGETVHFKVDAYPDHDFTGRITAIGARVDPDTRNIDIQATLDNPKELLRPGLYGEVTLSLGKPLTGVVVPDTAIAFSTFGDTVYVVEDHGKDGKTVHATIVHTAQERGEKVMLKSGIKAGDVVVIAGQNKLRDGVPVTVDNRIKP
ncbi:MAG TPA: efflux RND transporter periplasmic adaptor subunit [Nevskiaceae bacterium]